MTLQQLFDWCNKKSYFSRDDDEIWQAISGAAHLIYKEAVLENRGYFITFDTSSLVTANGQEEYVLPATVEQIVRLRERLLSTDPWRVIFPADLNDPATTDSEFVAADDSSIDGEDSEFVYNGPYAKMSDAVAGTYVKAIRLEPIPVDVRMTELVYTAKFIEISGPESPLVIDPEGHDAVKFLATAELLAANDDDNSERFAEWGHTHKTQYLKLVRARQIQQGRTVEPYVFDMD
jgi:hypothetical protein